VLAVVAVAALAHLLVTSVRARRSELALLRALGFSRHQLRAAVAWQASVVAVLAAFLGVPLGIALGRLVWSWFEEGLHAAAPAETPWTWAAVSVPLMLVVANVVAAIPGRAAGRTSPATFLRTD
jgi:ABC-type antimicrobial peptide transport system permease subunit